MLQEISEFDVIASELKDKDVDSLLDTIIGLLANQDQFGSKAPMVVVKLEALAAKFAILARYYTTIDKSDPVKKNLYYTLSEQAHQLAAAMKYVVR